MRHKPIPPCHGRKTLGLCVIYWCHRELPIEATLIGRSVETSDTEIVEVRFKKIDKKERVMLVDRAA
jgi:pyrimidine operon attenuation protein / uracil phosphoribosyltransferase